MLYNWSELERKGLNELWFLWFQAIERCIPIQKLAIKLGADFCKVIPAVHALTGCDYSSKAGTKAAALRANPVVYLNCFGSLIPNFDFKAQVQNAESYLCQVFKKQTAITDINKLRSWLYHHTKHTTLHSLPPSKGALLAHISRSFYISYQICSIFDEVKANLDTTNFGYIMEDDLLLPSNIITQLPENMSATANTVLLDGVIIGNYQSVAPNSANVWMKQKSLLNAKIYTQSISSFKKY